jgi:hypothetical protein
MMRFKSAMFSRLLCIFDVECIWRGYIANEHLPSWKRLRANRETVYEGKVERCASRESFGGFYENKHLIQAGRREVSGAVAGKSNGSGGVRRVDAARAHPRA